MDDLGRAPSSDRAAVFAAATADQGLPVHIIEKDFWVCWILKRLFGPDLIPGMVFKGGTSLSKGWGAIARFSEDVDLTLPRDGLVGAAGIDPMESMSKTQRKRKMDALRHELASWCAGEGKRELEGRIGEALGREAGWGIEAGGEDGDTLWFHYPQSADGYGYVEPSVRLEFGIKMPVDPWCEVTVQPFCASAGEYRMSRPDVRLRVLASERTFWEKVTIVHMVNNRTANKIGGRISRHYADVATLWPGSIGRTAMERIELLKTVAGEKELLYPSPAADYPAAGKGRLRMVPPESHLSAISNDYRAMQEMYYGKRLSFEVILSRMREIESAVLDAVGNP